jgi:hypothetical protein
MIVLGGGPLDPKALPLADFGRGLLNRRAFAGPLEALPLEGVMDETRWKESRPDTLIAPEPHAISSSAHTI